MERSHFPGYSQCRACREQVSDKDTHNHILNCRPKLSVDKKLCVFCNKQIDIKELPQHVAICNEQKSTTSNSSILPKKKCPICDKFVEDLILHCESCTNNDDENNNTGYQTPRAQTPPQIQTNSSTETIYLTKKQTKQCVLCSQMINESDYEDHVSSCSFDDKSPDDQIQKTSYISNHNINSFHQKTSIKSSPQNDKNLSKESNNLKKIQCGLCSQMINESDYEDHVSSCSDDHQLSNDQLLNNTDTINHTKNSYKRRNTSPHSLQTDKNSFSNKKQTKQCILCFEIINESDYEDHVSSCSDDQFNNTSYHNTNSFEKNSIRSSPQIEKTIISKNKQTKFCVLCYKEIDQSDYEDHVSSCSNDHKSSYDKSNNISKHRSEEISSKCPILNKKQKKECIFCFQSIDEEDYAEHVSSCSTDSNRNDNQTNSSNYFPMDNENSNIDSARANIKERKDCIICFKSIDLSSYEDHVLSCLAEKENQPTNSSTKKNLKCLTCNRSLNKDILYKEIACHSNHNHCLLCLQNSMEEFARNRQTPVCHKTLCDYELSRHDISLIPLERRLSDRLLKLVKGQQRPLCTICHFYIDINDNENLDEHIELCGDLIPCEYCQLPFPFQQLESHAIQCRSDNTSQNEKLANFVLKRTKYPFTIEQIRFFIQQQSKNSRMSLDPSSIIDALAVFGPTFPLEMPTRDCDVCMEARPYDDIYVFDCSDSHKLCYNCYYQSCQTKMANGEILTCAICTNPLRDGELNQLRVPKEELKKIREYQMKKTFDAYSSRTRGVIKCPRQNCLWVAEAADPNERFKVECPMCNNTFCSLCNQQYHYRTTCQQLPQITQRWFFWCQTERTRYLTMRAQQDATYAAQLTDYNRQTNENENRNRDLRRRYDELMDDERYKAQNCRLCPSCKRVVQRLEGCDSMICGQDAHGGNLQSGCKAKFNWAQAQPYTAAATPQPKQTIVDLPKPDNPVVHHDGVKCDQCQNDVNGIRFDCVHCPALTFCEKCEQQATLNHSRENQAFEQQQHVFKLIMVPQEEATQL